MLHNDVLYKWKLCFLSVYFCRHTSIFCLQIEHLWFISGCFKHMVMKNRNNVVKLISITLIVIVLLGLMFYGGLFDRKKADNPLREQQRTTAELPVKAMIMRLAPLTDKLIAGGSVMADEQVMIAAEIAGRIEKIHFEEGKAVKEGDLLITINNADLYAQIEKNRHQLELAIQLEQRQQSLLDKQGISQQTYDQVLTDLSTLQAEAALLQAQLDKTLLKAPFDGQLGLRQVSEGSYVAPGMPLVSLAKLKPVKLEFSIPERYTPFISRGSRVMFSVENQSGQFEAVIYALEPLIDQQTRSLPVRARYANEKGRVMPGSYARVIIPLQSREETMQLAAEALIPEMGSSKVFVYKNGQAMPRLVTTGLRTEAAVEITKGLNPGDTVLTSGLLQLRPGMKVQITEMQ